MLQNYNWLIIWEILIFYWYYKMTNNLLSCMQFSALWFYFMKTYFGLETLSTLTSNMLDKRVPASVELFSLASQITRSHWHHPSCCEKLSNDIVDQVLPFQHLMMLMDLIFWDWYELPIYHWVFTTCNTIPLLLPKVVGRIYVIRKEPIASWLLCFFVAPHIFTNVMFVGSRGDW